MSASFSLSHHTDGDFFEILLEGNLRVETLKAAREQILAHPAYSPNVRSLWDTRSTDLRNFVLPDMLEATRAGFPMLVDATVLLWQTEFQLGIVRQWTTLLDLEPDKLLITNERNEALAWIRHR